MSDSDRGRSDGTNENDSVAGPAAQAMAIAAANADEPMLEPRRDPTPRIVEPSGLGHAHRNENEIGGRSSRQGLQGEPNDSSINHVGTVLSLSDLDAEGVPPPAYSEAYNEIHLSQSGLKTSAELQSDGRINIAIKEDSSLVSNLLMPALKRSLLYEEKNATDLPPGYIPPSLGGEAAGPPPPPMNVVIHVVGSRGDVQPFVALGKVLKETYGHRVRLATHGVFEDFVTQNGLEFFCIGGDPAELMAFMVKNPGLMPGPDALRNGDVRKRRKGMYEIVQGCWRSCYEAGDGTGIASTDGNAQENFEGTHRPFVADAIIANPPSFAHIHCAEKLAVPLHLMFTMPWSPTQSFPHPLANIAKSTADVSMTNFLSYVLVELMTWQGLGDIINRFREKYLGLEPLSTMWAPALASRLRIPFTYCWSPALIPKPKDWGPHITISGFYFLSLASNYQPDADLQRFLDAGPPPVYIGFGSIVVEDPNQMTNLIFEAVKLSGQRALVSKGWGGFGSDDLEVPENIFMLGNVPHDWLFKHVSCVVHHGGAGTTAAGISCGCPTVVVPFFGDQPFWGAMVARAGAGPEPIPSKQLTAERLAEGIKEALTESSIQKAKELSASIAHEKGSDLGAKYFHNALDVDNMRCSLAPSRVAVWRIKRTNIKLSALAASVLGQEGRLSFSDLRLHRHKECDAEETPFEPIGGAASALMGTVGSMMMGVADIPTDVWRAISKKSSQEGDAAALQEDTGEGSSTDERNSQPTPSSEPIQSTNTSTPTLNSTSSTLRSPTSPSKSGRSDRNRGKSPTSPPPITMETAMDTTRGIGRFTEAGLKSPMDFTLALAKGFRNAPKLYGDTTIRPTTKVTGLQSGLKASAKEFGYGMYDGIAGFVTHPMEGAKSGGVSGFFKGVGKGIGGIALKPAAAFWSLPGYTFQGIYKEIKKNNGASLQNYIIAARTAQGFEDWTQSTVEERSDIVYRWEAIQDDIARQKKQWYQPYMQTLSNVKSKKSAQGLERGRKPGNIPPPLSSGVSPSRDSKSASAALPSTSATQSRPSASFSQKQSAAGPHSPALSPAQSSPHDNTYSSVPPGNLSEYEAAIRRSVLETSTGDEEEDAMIEEAIRQSLADLRSQPRLTAEEEARARSFRANLHHAQGQPGSTEGSIASHARSPGNALSSGSGRWASNMDSDDEDLRRAIEVSQEKTQEEKDADVELARAIHESRKAHDEQVKAQAEEEAVVEYMKRQSIGPGKLRAGNGGNDEPATN